VPVQITIIYDNTAIREDLRADWGFACLVKAHGKNILFDTGAKADILFDNMKVLGIEPTVVDEIFISHEHWDHTGGLEEFLKKHPAKVYIPATCPEPSGAKEIVKVADSIKIHENLYSTGELKNIEQSLIVHTEKGLLVVIGCAHSEVGNILQAAEQYGKVHGIVGGLHEFQDYDLIDKLDFVCPTHCTQHIPEIESRFPEKYLQGGAGIIIEI